MTSPSKRAQSLVVSTASKSPTRTARTAVRNDPFVLALQDENLRLQRELAKLEAKLVSANNRIKVLEELKPEGAAQSLSREELMAIAASGRRRTTKK